MNEKYIEASNGQIVVLDENGKTRTVDNCSNLDAILEQENLVEEIEKKISEKSKKVDKSLLSKISRFFPGYFIKTFIGCIGFYFLCSGVYLAFKVDFYEEEVLVETCIHAYKILILPFSVIVGGFAQAIQTYFVICEAKKEKGFSSQLDYLKKRLDKEKEKLSSLKRESKNKTTTNDESTKQISTRPTDSPIINVDIENLRRLSDALRLYYKLGYDEKSLLSSLDNSTLDDELPGYSTREIKEAEHVLTLRRDNKKRPK